MMNDYIIFNPKRPSMHIDGLFDKLITMINYRKIVMSPFRIKPLATSNIKT